MEYQLICDKCSNTFFGQKYEIICFWCQDKLIQEENPEFHKIWWEALDHQYNKLMNPDFDYEGVMFSESII